MAEIGIFLKVVIKLEREKRAEDLQYFWMGANLDFDTVQDVIGKIDNKKKKKAETSIADVNNDWKRLASFMSGKR